MTIQHQNPYVRGGLAAVEAFHGGQLPAVVKALMAAKEAGQPGMLAGGCQFFADALVAIRQAGLDPAAAPGLDERATEFLTHGHQLMLLELTAADPRDLAWRMDALVKTLEHHRPHCLKTTVTVTEPSTKTEPMAVKVVGMPATRATQVVERDSEGEILQTVTTTAAA
jgi:hypothetical protein